MAMIWGTPTPATMRVVQIEPGPMPTLTAWAPASTSASAASPVATLPPIIWCTIAAIGPLYGTRPSMPSGTSFSTSLVVSWK